jgi:uncharacterized protein YjeT (DUF2065 family)
MSAEQRERQKRTLTILGVVMLVAGAAVLLLLQRMPVPMRILVGLTDMAAGAVLLWIVRQKF